MPNVAIVYRQERSISDVGRGYFRRCGSRILRDSVAKKPDVVGLLGLTDWNKARGSAPSWLQRNLFPDDILFPLTKVQPS